MRRTILIWLGVFALLCFVIYVPIMEENFHIEQDPHYLDDKYQFKNNFNDPNYFKPSAIEPENNIRVEVDSIKSTK